MLSDLHPQARSRAERMLAHASAAGIVLLVTSTYRSAEEQAALFAQGRTAPGPIVTSAKPGSSYHNVRRAIDVAILSPETGTLDWRWMGSAAAMPLWERLARLAEGLGLHWGGRWKRPDRPHFEDTWCAACAIDLGPRGADHFDDSGRCRVRRTAA